MSDTSRDPIGDMLTDMMKLLDTDDMWSGAGQDEDFDMLPVPDGKSKRAFYVFYSIEDHELFSYEANDRLHQAVATVQEKYAEEAPAFRVVEVSDPIIRLQGIIDSCFDRDEMITMAQLEAVLHTLQGSEKA